jgi:biopolymer transport protein ExbD
MPTTIASTPQSPIAEINTTPLIDVMLVLLIMFVITIPAANHSLEIPLPGEGGPSHEILPVNTIAISPGDEVTWNSEPVTLRELDGLLAHSQRLPIEPELRFRPAGSASYGISAQVLAHIKQSGASAFGFVGNEAWADFPRQR